MKTNLTWDESKRQITLTGRGLDFADAHLIFTSIVAEWEDIRQDYGERRMICVGLVAGRLMVVGYVQRGKTRHIFSMRKDYERECKKFE